MKRFLINLINNSIIRFIGRFCYKVFSKTVLRKKEFIFDSLPSLVYSKSDFLTTELLVNLVAETAKLATKTKLKIGKDNLPDSSLINIFPGEHYRFLNSFVKISNSKKIVEIGTYTGLGTLALIEGIDNVSITTYDIFKWDELNMPSHFNQNDFQGSIKQIVGDLSDDDFFYKNLDILNEADLIFLDAPKDNKFEYEIAKKFQKLRPKKNKFLIVDDINFINMIDFWRSIYSPKIDASSFGHFSGTGIVDISNGFKFKI